MRRESAEIESREFPECGGSAHDVPLAVAEFRRQEAEARPLPETKPGDLIALMTAGAYGAAMSSTYNTRQLVPEVLVRGAEFAIVRPRQSYEDLIAQDRLPGWL